MIYLDNSATTPVLPEVAQVAQTIMMNDFFNPSAAYAPAVHLEKRIDAARKTLGQLASFEESDVYFTSGGTESNNIAIFGMAEMLRKDTYRFICSAIEHSAVFNVMKRLEEQGHEMIVLPVDTSGRVDLNALEESMDQKTAVVSIMHVNNELGVKQDLHAIASIVRKKNPNTVFHSDGVQAFGKMKLSNLPVDAYSISGHKFYAPKGVGALFLKKGQKNAGGQRGGGQEKGLRSGTLNTSGIVAMAKAAEILAENHFYEEYLRSCKKIFVEDLMHISDVFVNGPSEEEGVAHILNMSFVGVRGEVLLHALEEKEIYISTGSACSSHQKGNRMQRAIGLTPKRAESAVRFSFGLHNTIDQMHEAAQKISDIVTDLRRFYRR